MLGFIAGLIIFILVRFFILNPLHVYLIKRYGKVGDIWFVRLLLLFCFVASGFAEVYIFMYIMLFFLAINMIVYNPWTLPGVIQRIENENRENRED